MNPAPAISTRSTQGDSGNCAISAVATSRGLRRTCFATCIATFDA